MGYTTSYTLEILDADAQHLSQGRKRETIAKIKEFVEEGSDLHYVLTNNESPIKWHEWKEDMKKLSGIFQENVFRLDGEGEDATDIWTAWFCAGKSYTWKPDLTPPPFDPTKLA